MARKPKETSEQAKLEMKKNEAITDNLETNVLMNQGDSLIVNRSRCGGTLRETREKQGLSTQEIASRLRLSNKQIESLEADNFAALPEATIVKGFIRNYAKQLKIDAEPLLDAYSVMSPSKAPQSFTLKPTANMQVTQYQKPKTGRYMLMSLALLLGLGAWFFYQHYIQKPNPITPTASLTKPNTVEVLPEAALPVAERATDGLVTELALPSPVLTGAEAIQPSVALPADAGVNNNQAAAPVVPAVPASNGSPLSPQPPVIANQLPVVINPPLPIQSSQAELTTMPVSDMRNLILNATQETWVSVRDASGKEVYSKILFAGNSEAIEAKSPLNITVGNALGATLIVNGKPVDLAPHTRTNVAHVKID